MKKPRQSHKPQQLQQTRTGYTIDVLAKVGRCDVRIIHKLAEAGIVVRVARGRYDLMTSVSNMIEYYRERAAGRADESGSMDVVKASAEFKDSQRRLNDLKIKQLEATLISIQEVEEAWGELVVAVKALFLSAPSRIRFDLPHLTGADQEIIERTVRDMLTEVAIEGRPKLPDAKRREDGDVDN